jgi:hypothetical protein
MMDQDELRAHIAEEQATRNELLRADLRTYLHVMEGLFGDALEDRLDELMEALK